MTWTPRPPPPEPIITHFVTAVGKDGRYVPGSNHGLVIEDTNFLCVPNPTTGALGRAALIFDDSPSTINEGGGTLHCLLEGPKMWGRRGRRFKDYTTYMTAARGVVKEHGFYDSVAGGKVFYERVLAEDCGANGFQLRHERNAADPDWKTPKQVYFSDAQAIECGLARGLGRAAFAMSIKTLGPESDLWLTDLFLQTVNQSNVVQGSDGQMKDSFGGLCVEFCRNVYLRRSVIEFKNPANPPVQFYDSNPKTPWDQCAPMNIRWFTPTSVNKAIHLREKATLKCRIDRFDLPGEFVIHGRDTLGRWTKVVDRVPFTQGIRW